MNAKLLFKTLFLIIILALLVLMGLHNNDKVTFRLPPLSPISLNVRLLYTLSSPSVC